MIIKFTLEITFTNRPDNARKCLSMLSCLEGAKGSAAQIIEKLDDSGAKTIRIPFLGSHYYLLEQIKLVLNQYDDIEYTLEFPPREKKSEKGNDDLSLVGARVRIGKPLKGDSDIYEGREGVVKSIADEVDVRFDLGYQDLSGLFPIERVEIIAPHVLAVGDVVSVNRVGGHEPRFRFGIVVNLTPCWQVRQHSLDPALTEGNEGSLITEGDEGSLIYGDEDIDAHLTYIRPSRLAVGDSIWVQVDEDEGDGEAVLQFMDHQILGFNRAEDGTELVLLESGSEVPMSRCSLNMETLAILVEEQEALIDQAELEAQEPMESLQCERCAGCGQIADDEDGTPWSTWEALPQQSKAAINMGLVKPIPCPDCNGTGKNLKPISHEPDLFDETELQNPTEQPISDEDLEKAMELLDMEERLNPVLLQRTYGWGIVRGQRVMDRLRELGRIPCPGDPTEEQIAAVEETVNA